MKILLLLCIFNFSAVAQNAALSLTGISPMNFQSKALMEVFWIDVYEISHYKSEGAEAIQLDYLRDVEAKHSCEGWQKGLKQNIASDKWTKETEEKVAWLCQTAIDVKKGDKLVFYKEKSMIKIYLNQKMIQEKTDEALSLLILLPWLGPKPVAPELLQKS